MNSKSYYLSFTEFYLLASKMGINSIYGFTDSVSLNPSPRDIAVTLNHLVRNKLMSVDAHSLTVKSELKELFEYIVSAKDCVVIYSSGPVYRILCCYVAAKTVITEISEDGNKIKLSCMENHEIIEFLEEESLISRRNTYDPGRLYEGSETIDYLAKKGYEADALTLRSMDNICCVFDFMDCRNIRKICRGCFVDDTVPESLAVLTDGASEIFFGTGEIIEEIMTLWRNCYDKY